MENYLSQANRNYSEVKHYRSYLFVPNKGCQLAKTYCFTYFQHIPPLFRTINKINTRDLVIAILTWASKMSMVLSAPKSSSVIEVVSKRYEDHVVSTPLSSIVEAFEDIDKLLQVKKSEEGLRLDTFCHACSRISILFGCLGVAFKFAESEYVSKVYFYFFFFKYFTCIFLYIRFTQISSVKKPSQLSNK